MSDNIKSEIRALREAQKIAYLASVNEEGYPQMKAVVVVEHDSLREHYFSTNTSSKRVSQFLQNPKASVYYCDNEEFKGALFTGTIEICTDRASKERMWFAFKDNFGDPYAYYPKGIDDEDYTVLKFTAETVNYYNGGENATLSANEL